MKDTQSSFDDKTALHTNSRGCVSVKIFRSKNEHILKQTFLKILYIIDSLPLLEFLGFLQIFKTSLIVFL